MTTTIITLIDGHVYVVIAEDASSAAVIKAMGRWATNPLLNFAWTNYAEGAETVKELVRIL
jgi:hypothetical protein